MNVQKANKRSFHREMSHACPKQNSERWVIGDKTKKVDKALYDFKTQDCRSQNPSLNWHKWGENTQRERSSSGELKKHWEGAPGVLEQHWECLHLPSPLLKWLHSHSLAFCRSWSSSCQQLSSLNSSWKNSKEGHMPACIHGIWPGSQGGSIQQRPWGESLGARPIMALNTKLGGLNMVFS